MNTELRKLIVGSEGRYPTESEVQKVRAWALGMSTRIDLAARLEGQCPAIVGAVSDQIELSNNGVAEPGWSRVRAAEATRTTLTYLANAVVREDVEFFRRAFVDWYVEALRAVVPKDTLVRFSDRLRAALVEKLDAHEVRALAPYLEVLEEALAP